MARLERARRLATCFDWALLIAVGLGLLAAGPFLTRPGLPTQTDAELHVYRAAEIGFALRGGVLYPRWAPNLFLGYGYPIFNYYAPLTYYLANIFGWLPGLDIVGGTKAVFVLGLVAASVGCYGLGRDLFGRASGLLASAAFSFSPYVVLIDPHARGDLAEHFAVCLLPVVFFCFHRLMALSGGRVALVGSVLALGTLVLSHNLIGLVGSGLLFAYWAYEVAFGAATARPYRGLMVFVLAAAISAFFWLPALLEWDRVELVVTGPGHFDFRNHFLTLPELLAPSPILDMGAAAPAYCFNLGLGQWVLALPALIALRDRVLRRRVLPFAVASVCLVLLMTAVSLPVWEVLPGMAYLQFPWRLLGLTSFVLAVCVAATGAVVSRLGSGSWLTALVLAVVLLLALPVLYPPMWPPDFGSTDPSAVIAWEVRTGALGTTSTRDFVPKGAALVPMRPVKSLVASYAGPGPVDKINRATIPDGAAVEILEHGPSHDLISVSTEREMVLRLYTFDFAGWRAYVDGVATEIEIAHPEGFITVRVPAGRHDVLVRFEDTPPRIAGWLASATGMLALLGVVGAWRPPSNADRGRMRSIVERDSATAPSDLRALAWMAGTVLAFAALKGLVIDPRDSWLRYTSPPGQALPAENRTDVVFGGQIQLLGFDLERSTVRSGAEVRLDLYWHAIAAPASDYQSFVHLTRPLHILWGQEDHLNPGDLPTRRWPLDKYVRDEYAFGVLPGTPPGEYLINVGLYSLAGGYRLATADSEGQAAADSVAIATITVERPKTQPTLDDLDLTYVVDKELVDEGVTLIGVRQPAAEVGLAEPWTLTLFWRADQDAPSVRRRDFVAFGDSDEPLMRVSGALAGSDPADWLAGDVVRDPIALATAESLGLDPGLYRLAVGIGSDSAAADTEPSPWIVVGEVRIRDE